MDSFEAQEFEEMAATPEMEDKHGSVIEPGETSAIYIVLDETDPTNPIFVEIENERGESISIGKRIEYYDSELTGIKITHNMIVEAIKNEK